MRPIRDTIPLDEASAVIAEHAPLVTRVEIVPLHEANGRVIARDVTSDVDVPPFSRAGMDGYASKPIEVEQLFATIDRVLARDD